MGEILAAIKTLWEIIQVVKSLARFVEENKNEQWWQDFARSKEAMRKAQTPEERRAAISDYARSLAGL